MKKLFVFTVSLLFSMLLFAQIQTTVEKVIENPGIVIEEKVVLDGTVKQFIPESSTTNAHYLLEGKYGGVIKVKTDEAEPIKNKKYRVTGTVYQESGRPFIHERSKTCLDCEDGAILPPPPTEKDNTLLYIILGACVLLVILVIIFFIQSNNTKKKKIAIEEDERRKREQEISQRKRPSAKSEGTPPAGEYSTIKITNADPKTMKFIPGKLEIITGDDKGKSFRMAGYPTVDGSIITIGRAKVTGERAYAHIAIDSKFQTVSREQAKLIYKDGKLFVENLSETNLTQVDGTELKAGQTTELKPGSVMKTGELEFKYIL